MALPYEMFTAGYAATILTGTVAGLIFFVGLKNIKRGIILLNVRRNWILLMILTALPLLLLLESRLTIMPDNDAQTLRNVSWMLEHGGDLIRYLQNRIESSIITDFFIFIYVWVFTFLIFFTPIYLLVKNDTVLFKKYSFAVILNYLILLPFYLFLPVSVTSYAPETMLKPLLYIDTNWGMLVTSMDPLDNDFPSGHISILLTTLLIMASSYHHRKYTHFVMWGLIAITFAILYLGIHWIMDVIGGIALAVVAVLIVMNTKLLDIRFPKLRLRSAEEMPSESSDELEDRRAENLDSSSPADQIRRFFRRI
ncbi:MAG TPA: inositol phosphorylceramide synthase [Euryarchaeota archaeon]|nr:inositol phosphorylceramide synthase [Euryarchaeota archaeon]